MIYTDKHAELLKPHTGEKWRPSNGTEGDLFFTAMCSRCNAKETCPIPAQTMAFDTGDDEYPEEWCIDNFGQPTCTAFDDA